MAAPEAVISDRGLRKSYGRVEAVVGIDVQVSRGEIFAFLSPNGPATQRRGGQRARRRPCPRYFGVAGSLDDRTIYSVNR